MWKVQWGPTPALGSETTPADAGSGAGNVAVTSTLTGLTAGATYYYKFVANNDSGGSGQSAVQTVTVKPNPTATAGAPGTIKSSTAVLNGTINPGGEATMWKVQWGRTPALGSQTVPVNAGSGTVNVAVTSTLTGLKMGATYYYKFVANNDSGGSGQSTVRTFKTVSNAVKLGKPKVDKKRNIGLSVTIGSKGKLTLIGTFGSKKKKTYGKFVLIAKAGGKFTLKIKPSPAALKALKKAKKLKVTLTIKFEPIGGTRNVKTKTVTVNGFLK
jgi:VCBS repeat-containing protein